MSPIANRRHTQRSGLLFLVWVTLALACTKKPSTEPANGETGTGVFVQLKEMPYERLSTYRFFEGPMAQLRPTEGVLPYAPITPLFSDYAEKSRFVWMPRGSMATYVSADRPLEFPDGAVLIKNFYYERAQPNATRRILETRLLFKRQGQWQSAVYVWNADQTEAVLDMQGSEVPVTWEGEDGTPHSVTYRIPSGAECFTCHKQNNTLLPIGPKPQNLRWAYAYPEGAQDQLSRWQQTGYLAAGYPGAIVPIAQWDDGTEPLDRRVRAYLDMNCAHCHSAEKHCSYRPMRFAWKDTEDPVNMGLCIEPQQGLGQGLTHIVAAGDPYASVLFYRMSSTLPEERMPLMGRTLVHQEAKLLFEEWINTLGPPCE
jgi:uncharacterized repeat protein (TIGR03806 family)